MRRALTIGLGIAALVGLGCGDHGASPAAVDALPGELLDAALVTDGRLVAVGHELVDGSPRPLALALHGDGALAWRTHLGGEGAVGQLDAVVVDEGGIVYVAGRLVTSDHPGGVGEVAALDEQGAVAWRTEPVAVGSSEVEALAVVGDDLYVTGFAEIPDADGNPQRGMLVARLARATGALEWSDVLEAHSDPLGFTTGVSLDVSELSYVGAAGFAAPGRGRTGWLVGMWSTAGERLWESLRSVDDALDLGWEGGDLNLARAGRFDAHGRFLVVGDLFRARDGSDRSLVSYAADTGAVAWESLAGAALDAGEASFDEGTALVTSGDDVWVASSMAAREEGDVLAWEAAVTRYDGATGEQRWEAPFLGTSTSGERILDLGLDADGNVYAAGFASDAGGIGKHAAIEKLDGDGQLVWSAEVSLATSDADDDYAAALAVAPDGASWLIGRIDVHDGLEVPSVEHFGPDGTLRWSYPAGVRER